MINWIFFEKEINKNKICFINILKKPLILFFLEKEINKNKICLINILKK